MSVDHIELWHSRARPKPQEKELNVQMGCHFEEVAEMLDAVQGEDDYSVLMLERLQSALLVVSMGMKNGHVKLTVSSRKDFLDSLCDQIVTAVGVGHCANMKITEAVRRVNTSNWTKFDVSGYPNFDKNGKIQKGPNYHAPDLEGLY